MTNQPDPRFNQLLLIDDEPGIRRLMALDLTADGYEVQTAEDGASGLAVFQAWRPSVVITDLKMPGVDGLEVLKRVKEDAPDTEVIVITGHGDLDLAIESLRLHAGDFITKPINHRALEVALARAQERLGLKAELAAYTRDLEERVALATSQALASQRLAAVGEAVASLVHSLKNMCSGMRGGVYLVEQGRKESNEDHLDTGLAMLNRNLKRIKILVANMLSLSKPREPDLAPLKAEDLAAEVMGIVSDEAREAKVKVAPLEIPPDLVLNVDRRMMLDALCNLLSNAVDATASRPGAQVKLSAGKNGTTAWLAVEDNGPGLDEEALAHVFESFYSSKGSLGTGLGLMVTRKIAQEHGGRLEMDNRPGKGATFRLVLPLGPEEAGLSQGMEPGKEG
ncbi:MAG: hybrid sensor histidine kinase/response regulator [Deltaproteobacteria bacterium]|nr:hybrid sensor histidine kinase/response regulator [Deltaproteobacteria bacterium]